VHLKNFFHIFLIPSSEVHESGKPVVESCWHKSKHTSHFPAIWRHLVFILVFCHTGYWGCVYCTGYVCVSAWEYMC